MDAFYKKLEIIISNYGDETRNTVFFGGTEETDMLDEMDIANEFQDVLRKSLFSLGSKDFIIPFLKNVISYRLFVHLIIVFLQKKNLRTKFFGDLKKGGIWTRNWEKYNSAEKKTLECCIIYNYLIAQLMAVSNHFDVDFNDIREHRGWAGSWALGVNQVLLNERYLKLSDEADRSNTFKKLDIVFDKHTEKIAWLNEIGILDTILNKYCKVDNSFNFSQAGKIINSFTDIPIDTARKCINDIYNKGKNNPLKSADNVAFVNELKRKLKIV